VGAPFGFRKASRLHAPSFSRLFLLSRFTLDASLCSCSYFSRWFLAFPDVPCVVP